MKIFENGIRASLINALLRGAEATVRNKPPILPAFDSGHRQGMSWNAEHPIPTQAGTRNSRLSTSSIPPGMCVL